MRNVAAFLCAMCMLACGAAFAQGQVVEAVTSNGEKVRLLPDGRWEWADAQKAAVQRNAREAEAKRQEEVRQAELKRERGAQGGGQIGLGRTLYEGDKDYNRGTLNPKMR